LGTHATTDTNMFQVIKALNSLNMTSPIQLSNGTKIIFCSSFHDATYEKENRCPGIFTVDTSSAKQEKCDSCAIKARNERRREIRLNDNILESNSHANLCNLSKPQLVQRLKNVKEYCNKKMRKKVESITHDLKNEQFHIDIDMSGDMAEAFSSAVTQANTNGGKESIRTALQQLLKHESRQQG